MNSKEILDKFKINNIDEFLKSVGFTGELSFLTFSGSFAYGMESENSDLDLIGFEKLNEDSILELRSNNSKEKIFSYKEEEYDINIYSYDKFIKMLMSSNPNTLPLLGVPNNKILVKDDIANNLLDNKNLFVSKKMIGPFSSFADNLLKQSQIMTKSYEEFMSENECRKNFSSFLRTYFTIDNVIRTGEITVEFEDDDLDYLRRSKYGTDISQYKFSDYKKLVDYYTSERYEKSFKKSIIRDEINPNEIHEMVKKHKLSVLSNQTISIPNQLFWE